MKDNVVMSYAKGKTCMWPRKLSVQPECHSWLKTGERYQIFKNPKTKALNLGEIGLVVWQRLTES